MRTILIGVEDLGVRLAERLISTVKRSSLLERGAKLILETYYVDDSGRRERLRASYELDDTFLGESETLVEKLAPGIHRLRVIPKKRGLIFPEVRGELRVEPEDEEIRAVAEVYQRAIPRGRVARWYEPLLFMLLAGMIGLALGAIRLAAFDPSTPSIYLKFLLLSSVPSSILHALLFFGKDFTDQPSDEVVRSLLGVYLTYVSGLGAAFLLDYLYLMLPHLQLPFSISLTGMLEEEIIILLLGSYGSLTGLVIWLLREFRAALPEVLILESWISVKRRLIMMLLVSMATGGAIASTLTSYIFELRYSSLLLPAITIPVLSLLAGLVAGIISEYLSRDRRWDLAAPLFTAAGTYTVVQAALSFVSSFSPILGLPISPLEPLVGLNLGSPVTGALIVLLLLRRIRKVKEPCLCILSVRKGIPTRREAQSPLEVFGIAISHEDRALNSAWNISQLEEGLKEFRPGSRLRLRIDPTTGPAGEVRRNIVSLAEYVVWRCGHPPDLAFLLVDAVRPGLMGSLASILNEVRVLDVPLISLVMFSSSRREGLDGALREMGKRSNVVLLADVERALSLGETMEESVEAFLDELTIALDLVISSDRRGDPSFRLSASTLGKLLSHPERVDPFGTIGLSMLDPEACMQAPSPDNLKDMAAMTLLNSMAGFDGEERAWGLLLMRGPRDCMYLWAAKGELERRLGRGDRWLLDSNLA